MYNEQIRIPTQLQSQKLEGNKIGGLPYRFNKYGESRQNKCVATKQVCC